MAAEVRLQRLVVRVVAAAVQAVLLVALVALEQPTKDFLVQQVLLIIHLAVVVAGLVLLVLQRLPQEKVGLVFFQTLLALRFNEQVGVGVLVT